MIEQGRATSIELERWRSLDAASVLSCVANYVKEDLMFKPKVRIGESKVHAVVGEREFDFVVLGPKWFDLNQKRGGGGAVDLIAHVFGHSFKQAVAVLRKRGL